ncbi:MAG: helix-turn-helix domain-containing protein [Polyangiales bacterium]
MEPAKQRTIRKSIAANIRRLREEQGLSQAELAERSGVDLRVLQRIESGKVDFRVSSFVALAEALTVTAGPLVEPASLSPRKRGRPRKSTTSQR